ncbi:MAG: hypothetical protein B7X41_03700 [Microbacterium sp. 14-71-5]|nr:MAG: hypothetical protein B7X41_03700 [Microbacterium sp. 14-71-5]
MELQRAQLSRSAWSRRGHRRRPDGALHVWVFADLPLGQAVGPSYMVESWQRELRRLGLVPRTFTPSGALGEHRREPEQVTFRSLRDIGYAGDHNARYSVVAELVRARRERPDVVLVSTVGRVGLLGMILAAVYAVPLVMVVSTDTMGATAFYSPLRAVGSAGVKPLLLMAASRRARAAFRRTPTTDDEAGAAPVRAARFVERTTAALHADAREVVLLSPKGLSTYGRLCPDARVTVLPSGIDRLPRAPAPAELTWRPGGLRVLYVGRLAPEKNLSVLIGALRGAVDAGLDVQLALVGEGPLRERLVAEATALGVRDRLVVAGPYPRAGLGGVYAGADVFAFPSTVDTQAYVLNEAAHEGLPLLVSDTANGVVEDGVSALVVPADPQSYARALATLCDGPLRQRLGAAARRRAQLFGEAAQCARLADVVERAAGRPFLPWMPMPVPAPDPGGSVVPRRGGRAGDDVVTASVPTR